MTCAPQDPWLASVLPSSSKPQQPGGQQLEMHKRLVQLAELREAALQQLGQLDAVKVALTERKIGQQSRLLAALGARLAAAHAAVDPHRSTAWDAIMALEREAAFYSSILRGLQPAPPSEQWAAVSQRFHSLVAQQQEQQQAVPPDLGTAFLEQVPEAEAVEQLQARCNALQQQLQAAHVQQQAAASAAQQERTSRLAAEQQCSQLQGQLQQLADAATALKSCAAAQDVAPEHQRQQTLSQEQQLLESEAAFADTLDESLLGDQWLDAGAAAGLFPEQQQQQQSQPGAADAMRQLRQAFNAAVCAGGQQHQQQQQLHVVRLRLAYQQMLSQVQARYQQSLRQAEQQHKQALQARQHQHEAALAQLRQEHEAASSRLAAASATQEQQRQQLSRLGADNKALQQQVAKLQTEVAHAAASALAVAQVQHEQQLLAAKAEQQAALQEARQQAQRLQQQVDELRQQLLQQREAQHTSLLAELAAFKQLQEQPSAASLGTSSNSDGDAADAGVDGASAQLHASNGGITCGSDPAALHEFRGFTPSAAVADACAQAVAALESNTGLPEQLWGHGMLPQQQQQQQQHGGACGRSDADQRPSEPAGSAAGGEPDAMSSLIAAVLGSGPRGQQQMMQHQQRMRQQLAAGGSSSDSGHAAKLDRVLGMSAAQGQARGAGGRGPPAAVSQAPPAGTGGISATTSSSSSSSKGGMSQPAAPWRPSSASLIKASAERRQHEQQQQLQQWQAFQQHSEQQRDGGSAGSAGSRSPSPSSPQKQGAAVLPALVCARCGLQEGAGSGECCFHPGLVSAPGPLLFGPEWHACKARCRPEQPGCFTRREHFFTPACPGSRAAGGHPAHSSSREPVQPSRSAASPLPSPGQACTLRSPVKAAAAAAAAAVRQPRQAGAASTCGQQRSRSASPVPARAAVAGGGSGRVRAGGSSTSSRGGAVGVGALAPPEPRSVLPRPSVRKQLAS